MLKKIFLGLFLILTGVMLVQLPAFALNLSPVIIPNIQQWTGGTGTFTYPSAGRICYEQDALATTANTLKDDILGFTNVTHTVVKTDTPAVGDIFLTLTCTDPTIGTEGYLMDIATYVKISANADAGAFYGTRTLLQILKQDTAHANVPYGAIKDFPKYKERGFMLDVARKYFTPQYLESYIRQMAWLKLNDFHLHFTDDQGFRLKSDSYPSLSFDQGYSKAYLRTLQDIAAKYHVTITPEIDLPGHASAVVSAYPGTGHTPGTVLNPSTPGLRPIDLSKDASWNIAYGLLDEFVPLFDAPDFHIGGDEYPGYGAGAGLNSLLQSYPELLVKAQSMGLQTEADLYYYFINSMGDYVETHFGKKARFWEWAERFKPYTSINIQNDMIFDAWEGPEAVGRSAEGFKIINSNWKATYIVPGTNMYPDMTTLYQQWQPNWLDLTGSIQLAADDPNLLGAKLHNWNDYAGAYNEGGLDRFTLLPMKVFSEDIWGAPRRATLAAFKTDVNTIGNAPGHGVDLVGAWKFEETSGTTTKDTSGYTKTAIVNGPTRTTSGKFGSALVFDGVDDTVNITEPDISGSWTASVWVNRTASATGNAVLMDSENSSIKLEQTGGAKVGFTNKTTSSDYFFNYTAPVGTWVNLTFVGNATQTTLYVNGVLNQSLAYGIKCPMDTIGSSTDSAKGTIDEIKVFARELDATAIASLQTGMLMYMPFEDSDATIALDTSGSLYNGVIKSPTQRTDAGKEGKGILLSNRNSEIVLCHDDVSGPWTTSIWVNKTTGSLGGPILRSYLSAISIGSTGIPKLTVHGVADYPFTTAISDDVWTNLTFTSDGVSQTSLYVNGEFKETISNTISLPLMTLGYWWQAFDGKVDELKVYDRVLSASEISSMVGYTPWVGELTTNSVQLKWNKVTGATGYNIYKSTDPTSGYVKINASTITDAQYFDFGLTSGTTCYYKMTYILGTESAQSNNLTVAVPTEVLLSLNKPLTAEYSAASHGPELANDNSLTTYWDGGAAPNWLIVDLMDQYDLTKVNVTNYVDGTRYYKYNISASTDGLNWTQIAAKTSTSIATDTGDLFTVNIRARYVKVDMIYGSTGTVHIKDFKVYGKNDISSMAIPTSGIKGYWNFNEGTGTTATDTSGNANNGTITGATWSTSGKNGNALYFDGNDDIVTLTQTADITSNWTASMWVKREDSTSSAAILMNSANSSLRLEQYSGTNMVGFTKAGTGDFSYNYLATIGEWVNLTFVGTDSGTSLYVNGMYNQFIPVVISCPMSTIGRNTLSLKGTMDEVRIYNRALTANEVRAIAGIVPASSSNMVAYWNFNEGSGTTAADTSGSGHNGTISGAAWTTAGKYGNALTFDGDNDYINIACTDITGSWTAAMWVNRTDNTGAAAVLMNSSANSLRLEQNSNTNKVGFTKVGIADKTFNYTAPVGTWVHLTYVGTSTGTSIYVNGLFQETIATVIGCPMSTIGRSTLSLKGTLDEVKIFNHALTASEIYTLANSEPTELVSQGKPVTASSYSTGHEPLYANDADKTTYWDGAIDAYGNAWCQIDLQSTYKINMINLRNYVDGSRYYKYYIRTSLDGYNWEPLATKSNTNVATDAGDTYNVSTVARYVRVNVVYNSVNSSVHICDFKVYGYAKSMPSADAISVTNFNPDKSTYLPGDSTYLSYSLKNNTTSSLTVSRVIVRKYGLTNPLIYDETQITSNVVITAGATYNTSNQLMWILPSDTELGAYGFWVMVELNDGTVYNSYSGFTRVVNSSTLLKYTVGKQNYNGLNVYTLDGGMSAEATVEKSLENLDSATSHSWYMQSNGGPNFVYSSRSFFTDSIQQTVDYYNTYLGATTHFDTVILATGNCAVNYLSRVTKAPVLPTQFLVSVNTYKELRKVVDYAKEIGIPTYSTLGYDSSMGIGVAWVKMLDLPAAYKTFLTQHGVKNVIIAATSGATNGESTAKKALEKDTVVSGTSDGDIFLMYPTGTTNLTYDIDQLSRSIKDFPELNLETDYRNFSDWESGMLTTQVDALAASAKTTMGTDSSAILITSDDSQKLYDYATYAVCKFYKKNEAYLGTNPVQGVVINPYLIAHPAYDTKINYVPAMFWQGNYTGKQVADIIVQTTVKNAILAYFPSTNFNSLNFWINYSNNFGGQAQALDVKNELLTDGLTNILENDYTKNEIWDTSDGMDAPVERIAQNIITYSSPTDMKNYYASMSALNNQDLIDITSVYTGVTVTSK